MFFNAGPKEYQCGVKGSLIMIQGFAFKEVKTTTKSLIIPAF